ncbi:complement factor B-like isoform X2 [Hemitrygon akajei]|uniref:complement factor B-like isoform X2 n=1 Tax=Hemitrygon akajei TaxID=2704970 RepID=UPI003BF9B879
MEPFLWFLTLSFSLLFHTGDVTGTTCGPADPITGGRSSSPPRPRPGSVLEYHCPAGSRPFPVAWRVCMQSGRWSPLRNAQRERSQTAQCRPYRCVSPMLLEHGYFQPRLLQYRVNQTVQFVCNQGFALLGSPNRTCLSNGRWSGNAAICYAGDSFCPDPGIPLGGSRKVRGFDVGDTVSYLCSSGLGLRGSRTRTCLPTGRWSGRETTCESWYAFDFAKDVANQLTLSEEILGHAKQGVHIYFLLDASGSVGEENFQKTLEFVAAFSEKTHAVSNRVQFHAFCFASRVLFKVSSNSEPLFAEDFHDFNYTAYLSEMGTNISGALDHTLGYIRQAVSATPPETLTRQIIILLTDGRHNVGRNPVEVVKKIKEAVPRAEENLDIFAIGIGDGSKEELEQLVTSRGEPRTFYFANYNQLEELTQLTRRPEGDIPMGCGMRGRRRSQREVARVYGGEDAVEKQWPWQIRIQMSGQNGNSMGAGSIISQKWILTAAHNLFDDRLISPANVQVFVGELKRRSKNSNAKEVTELHVHPSYNNTRASLTEDYSYDIGLLRLKEDLQFSDKIRPVCLPCSKEVSEFLPAPEGGWADQCSYQDRVLTGYSGSEWREITGYISGWGLTEKGKASYFLKYGKISIKPRDQCLRNDLDLSQICAKGDGVDTCAGDSGGPFSIKIKQRWIQIGIVSSGTTAQCSANNMGYYTNVARMMDWVRTVVADLAYN